MFGEDDEDEDDLAPNAADNAFIDDTELAPDLRVDFTDEGPEGGNPEDAIFDEAEEAAEELARGEVPLPVSMRATEALRGPGEG